MLILLIVINLREASQEKAAGSSAADFCGLQPLKIETIEDILRYALKNGLDSLLDLPGFGALGLAQLKFQLEKHKIIDKTGHSDLYQYIICEADN